MPTNTRTPSGGSTSGSTGSTSTAGGVCWTGGADEAGTLESLEERVLKLEKALALILGQDVETGQLSNISGQIGWVEGVTYLGHEGWTKTQYGSLIPPPGVSLSDLGFDFTFGGRWSLVTVDENGVLQFGLGHLGQVGGAKVDAWDGAANPDTIVATFADNLNTNDDIDFSVGGGGVEYSVGDSISLTSATTFTLDAPGMYLISVYIKLNGGAGIDHEFRVDTDHDGIILGAPIFTLTGDGSGNAQDCKTIVVHKNSADTESLQIQYLSAPNVSVWGHVNITRLSGT